MRRDDGEESRPRTRQSPYDRIQDYVNDVAEEWRIAKDNFDRGLRRFRTTMTMTSEDEAVPDVTGALVSRVVGQVTGAAMNRLENLVPGWSQARGALDSMIGELGRAETAGRKVALRDFLLQVDDVMSRGFTRQIRAIRDGRQDTYERYESLPSDETRQAFLGSLPNWLQSVRNQIPSAEQYAASLFLEWVKRARGQISGWTSQGIIYLRFDARSRGAYRLQSATVAAPLASKVASGLNWVMQTSSLGMPNVLRLPIRKHIALLIRHGWGRSISDWAHLDENNYTVKRPIWPEGKRRWREMPLESALTAITRVRA